MINMKGQVEISNPNNMVGQLSANAVQRLMANNMDVSKALRTNALLRKDEWKSIDSRVIQVTKQRLTGIADLKRLGLIRKLGGLGTLIDEWETQSEMTDANIDMDGATPGEEDTPEWNLHGVPVPIIHKDFRLSIRRLEASRKAGDPLDTIGTQNATKSVTRTLEDMLFGGKPIKVGNYTIHGYTNHPERNTGVLKDWSVIDNIRPDVKAMIKAAKDAGYYGPFYLYVNGDEDDHLDQIYSDGTGHTARERVLKLSGLKDIRVSDRLASGTVVLVQMTSDVIDLSVAQEIIPVEWQTVGGMLSHFKVMTAQVPRVKADDEGNSGIVVYS